MNAERLIEWFERVVDAPDAVARLRRFVLDLAVRGRLVEQDPADEPAAELLKRIAVQKAGFPISGRKASRKLNDDSLTGIEFSLPVGWATAALSDLVRVLNGRAYKKSELLDTGTPVLRVGNLFTSDHWYYSDLELDEDKYCDAGDLIYAWSASFGPFIWRGPRVIYHYHIWKLSFFNEIDLDKRFLHLFLLQKTREIKEAGHGVSMIHMTKEKMEQLVAPVPPLAEQHRIVQRVDELMALCDQLEAAQATRDQHRDRLNTAALKRLVDAEPGDESREAARFYLNRMPRVVRTVAQVKALRQTVLDLAVRGRLVEQDSADEPALMQLSRISEAKPVADRRREFRANSLLARTKTEADQIPSGWVAVRLQDIAVSMRYGTSIKCDYTRNFTPVLRIPNVSTGKVSIDDLKYGPLNERDREALALRAGDLLMIRSNGSLDIVGRSAIVTPDAAGMAFAGYLVRLRTLDEQVAAKYVWLALNSSAVREQIERPIRSAVGLKNVNLTEFSNLSFWLPPFAEQRRIVERVNQLMAICDDLEAAIETRRTTTTRLLDALIAEALADSPDPATVEQQAELALHG